MKKAALLFLLLSCNLVAEQMTPTALWLEPVAPGAVFFSQNRPVAGTLMLTGRVITLASAIHFHNRFADYASAEKAARLADLYYGPGMRYRDPYSSGFKSSLEFRKEADRNLNLASYSVGLHLILLGVGIYNGLILQREEELEKAPVYDIPQSTVRLPGPLPEQQEYPLFAVLIPLDF